MKYIVVYTYHDLPIHKSSPRVYLAHNGFFGRHNRCNDYFFSLKTSRIAAKEFKLHFKGTFKTKIYEYH